MIITQHLTPKDIAAKFKCSARAIAQLIRDRRIPLVDGGVDPAVVVIYAERLHAIACLTWSNRV